MRTQTLQLHKSTIQKNNNNNKDFDLKERKKHAVTLIPVSIFYLCSVAAFFFHFSFISFILARSLFKTVFPD